MGNYSKAVGSIVGGVATAAGLFAATKFGFPPGPVEAVVSMILGQLVSTYLFPANKPA